MPVLTVELVRLDVWTPDPEMLVALYGAGYGRREAEIYIEMMNAFNERD